MKTQIEKVKNYFKNKLLAGDFEIIEVSEHYCTILIDKEYPFNIWIGNMVKYPALVSIWEYGQNFMYIQFSKEERLHLYSIFLKPVNEHKRNVLINKKREELAELENELKLQDE